MPRVRIMLWYAFAWSYLVLSYPLILFVRFLYYKGKLKKTDFIANVVMTIFSKMTFYMSGSRLRLIGKENIPKDKTVVFVCNHQGHMDSMIIQGFINRPKGFLTIKKFGDTPILRTWMKYMGCVFMDKEDIRQSLRCINQAVDTLNRGHSMVVFPEGKLNEGGETLKFEKGWLRLVKKSGVPVVPITLKNAYNAFSYNGKGMHPAKIECIISKPIDTSNLNKDNEIEFMENLREIILTNL